MDSSNITIKRIYSNLNWAKYKSHLFYSQITFSYRTIFLGH